MLWKLCCSHSYNRNGTGIHTSSTVLIKFCCCHSTGVNSVKGLHTNRHRIFFSGNGSKIYCHKALNVDRICKQRIFPLVLCIILLYLPLHLLRKLIVVK